MQTATMKFNELEWRSDAVQASAGQMISRLATHSKEAFGHYSILLGLREINKQMTELLSYLHSPQAIRVIESSSEEERNRIGAKMHTVAGKVRVGICQLRESDIGFWKRVYLPRLEMLSAANQELCSHAEAFMAADSLIMLSKRDQDFMLESLMAPDEPNDALRRVFTR